MSPRALLALCVVLGFVAPADAQGFRRPGDRRAPEIPMDPFAAEGTIQAVMPPRIHMLTNSNQNWMIWVDPKAKVQVTGTAEADFLKAGMFIRFSVELDKRGKAQDKVSQLTIFAPSEESPVGIWPEGAGPLVGPAEDNLGGGFGGFGGDEGQAKGRGVGSGKASLAGLYSIAGQLRGVRKGKLTVYAGRGMVQIELADKPSINVDFADYSVAKKGDKISVTRGKMPRGGMGLAQANELKIEVAQPLSSGRKKPVRTKPPTPERPTRQPKTEDPKPEPVEAEPEGDS